MTTNPPAPESIIELTACGCKTGCKSDRCRCRKNKFVCTEMCRCKDCENTENDNYESDGLSGIEWMMINLSLNLLLFLFH